MTRSASLSLFPRVRPAALLALVAAVAGISVPAAPPEGEGTRAGRGTDIVRATVQIRNGDHRGSGTVIASGPGETLILTAAHVVKGATGLRVELHRHNLGYQLAGLTEGGGWPRLVPAAVVAADTAGDVALVRIEGMKALRYVARFDPGAAEPSRGEVLTSVGIDRTRFLTRWKTTVEGSARLDIGQGGGPSRFTITSRFPEHGRSGGGLFRPDGTLAGVCTGQLGLKPGQPKVGVFGSVESVRKLLRGRVPESGAGMSPRGDSAAPARR
jgi:S1-C subfamily serine protease